MKLIANFINLKSGKSISGVEVKVLKIISIVILALIVIIVVLGLILPKQYLVERSLVISAPKALVFNHTKYWKNWSAWSPWTEMDSTLQESIEGEDGTVGAIYKWNGNPQLTGKGEMTVTGLKDNEEITCKLHFLEPMEGSAEGFIRLTAEGEGCKVVWGIKGEDPFPWNIMQLFMDMDQMIGKDYERGLSLLKGICEKEAGIIAKYPVQTVEFKANKYAAIRKTLTMPEMSAFMSEVYGKIGEAMKKSRAKCLGPAVGIYYTWDEKTMSSDMAAGMPINKSITTNEILMIEIPADTAYLIDYYGSYSASVDAHTAMNLFFKMNNLKPKMPVIEEYITDPMTEPDSSKWLTKIYYFAE